ncbi:MAG: hypothetical protein ACKV22_24460 [Bryobacteraceae bacterium]
MSEESREEVERLKAEIERLKRSTQSKGGLTLKVSEKGAVSVYGLGRFPVTLYKEQWERLLQFGGDIQQFIADNVASLKKRDTAD